MYSRNRDYTYTHVFCVAPSDMYRISLLDHDVLNRIYILTTSFPSLFPEHIILSGVVNQPYNFDRHRYPSRRAICNNIPILTNPPLITSLPYPNRETPGKKIAMKAQNSHLCSLPIRGEAPTTGPVISGVGERDSG